MNSKVLEFGILLAQLLTSCCPPVRRAKEGRRCSHNGVIILCSQKPHSAVLEPNRMGLAC